MPSKWVDLLFAALLLGCGQGGAVTLGSDAGAADANQTPADVPTDATLDEADTAPAEDAACALCGYGHCPTRALCLNAPLLEPGVPVAMQDSAVGGYDCAVGGSGNPSRSLYYALTLPAQWRMRVVLTPAMSSEPALLRVLPDCYATTVELSARNFSATQDRATLCLFNQTAADRHVVIAAGSYSGDIPLTLAFTLSAELVDPDLGCVP